MSALEFLAPEAFRPPDGLVEVGAYPSPRDGEEHGLVVLALGCDYWLLPDPAANVFRLHVDPAAAPLVQRHLAAYARERLRWPPPPLVDPWSVRKPEFLLPLAWSALVLGLHRFSAGWLVEHAALEARAVFDSGEAWRAATALFIHGSAAHVISNALSGLLVFTALLTTLGRVRGLVLLAGASVLGNLLVAAINYPADYRSVGASTAIFAGIGLLTGRAMRVLWRATHPERWRALFVPLGAGFTVLALHGAGDFRVDVGAHLCGFLVGLVLGMAAHRPSTPQSSLKP